MVIQAGENLIERRETHLDQLVDKLGEERVRIVIEPVLSGKAMMQPAKPDDIEYVKDLGLIHLDQTFEYMVRCNADEAHLVIFDRDPQRSWDEKVFMRDMEIKDRKIRVWGM
jgi:hypothetical protein